MSIRKGSQIIAGLSNIDSINNQNPNSSIPTIYDWIGTLQEYTTQDIANTHPEWVCFVLNDSQGGADVYSKSETDALLDKKLGYEYLTNCLTKIPQDITVELENSVLTLKANSKIYVNNVAEVVPNDLSLVSKSGTFNEVVVVIDNNGTYELKSVNKDTSVYVQSNEPSDTTEIIWFNINTGIFKYYDENAIAYTCSLPICECIINTSVRTNISNVFNGYGRLGKIFFLLPDVEGLCTNGRNEDGQLKSIKFTNTILKILVVDDATKHYIIVDQYGDLLNYRSYYNNAEPSSLSVYESTYINRENIIVVKNTTGYEVVSGVYLGDLNNLQISTTFRAANYSDIDQKQDKLTAGDNISISNSNVISAVNTTYTAGSNINIDSSNVISAVDTTYTAGDNISIDSLNNNKIAVKEVVTYDNITNCIIKTPQNIKLEISGGTITLKAGSSTFVPNGGTSFEKRTYTVDKSVTMGAGLSGTFIVFGGATANSDIYAQRDNCFYSGANPTITTSVCIWYDTTANKIKFSTNSGSTWSGQYSFPLAIVSVKDGIVTSIKHVFNGIGYIDQTIFVLPTIEGLIPNGRNIDGTLNNINYVNTTVKITDINSLDNGNIYLLLNGTGVGNPVVSVKKDSYKYDEKLNLQYNDSTPIYYLKYSECKIADNKITEWNTSKNAFHAVDYCDYNELKETAITTSDITNCITKIPQDIEMEIENNLFVIKAGSKLYIPNGMDGTKRIFEEYIVESDIIYDDTGWNSEDTVQIIYAPDSFPWAHFSTDTCGNFLSGDTPPTVTKEANCWYDTSVNKIKYTDDTGATWTEIRATLPIAEVIYNDSNVEIKKVFNGYGYMGSLSYVLPGVEGLISNGRNEDGSLNNIPVKIKDVTLGVIPDNNWDVWNIYLRKDGTILSHPIDVFYESESEPSIVTETALWYNPLSNIMHWTQDYGLNWNPVDTLKIMDCKIRENQRIISCNMKKQYQAVDDNEFQKLKKRNIEYKHISNCITYVPEDIKVYIGSDTKFYLAPSSKLYIPDGLYAGGGRKFITFTTLGYYACSTIDNRVNSLLTYNTETNSINPWQANDVYSGTTMPLGTNNVLWYNPTTNECKARLQQQWYKSSLPFASANSTSTGGWTSISHVFNGIGYVGATSFVLPGVKCLIPKGRNQDGSLNSVEYTVDKVLINDGISRGTVRNSNDYLFIFAGNYKCDLGTAWEHQLSTDYYPAISNSTWHLVYDSKKNQYFRTDYGTMYEKVYGCDCHILVYRDSTDGRIKDISGDISTFKAVNYNDYIANKVIYYQNPTDSNDFTWFKLYGNGWVEQGGRKNVDHATVTTVNLPIPMKNREYAVQVSSAHLDCNTGGGYGTPCTLSINGKSSTQIYLYNFSQNGSMITSSWEVKGLSAII